MGNNWSCRTICLTMTAVSVESGDGSVVTTKDVASKIKQGLNGTVSRPELTHWAFTCFLDNGENRQMFDPDSKEIISDVLLPLMAMDEGPQFYLDDEALRDLIQKLGEAI
jgi:hypothetical protein